jgi:hypothetical protein
VTEEKGMLKVRYAGGGGGKGIGVVVCRGDIYA